MKKKILKIMPIIMVVSLMIGLSINVFAAGSNTVTINTGSYDVNGVTFNAYKVFDVTKSGTDTKHYGYTMTEDFKSFFSSLTPSITSNQDAYEYVHKNQTAIANELKTFIDKDNTITATSTTTKSGETITLSSLDDGYYIIIPTGEKYAPNLITVTGNENKTVNLKGVEPTVDKKVDNAEWISAQIGDTVTFTVESIVPDMTGQEEYHFQLVDTLSNGLTISQENYELSVKINGTPLQNKDYSATITDKNDAGTELKVVIKDFKSYANKAGEKIIFEYKAVLNEGAVIVTDQAKNTAKVEYGNNADSLTSSKEDVTYIKTHELTITKKAETNDGVALADAEFELYRNGVTNAIQFIKDNSDDGNNVYHVASLTEIADGTKNKITTVESPESGTIVIKGLDAGKYTLKETKAPAGYNSIEDTSITITATSDNNGEKVTVTGNKITVINKSGTELPSTGGIGTIIFTVGGVVIIGAMIVVSVISKKKNKL